MYVNLDFALAMIEENTFLKGSLWWILGPMQQNLSLAFHIMFLHPSHVLPMWTELSFRSFPLIQKTVSTNCNVTVKNTSHQREIPLPLYFLNFIAFFHFLTNFKNNLSSDNGSVGPRIANI